MNVRITQTDKVFGLLLPLLMILAIFVADLSEGTQTAYVGILAAVPPLAAVFGTVKMVIVVSFVGYTAAVIEAVLSEQTDDPMQGRRLIIIAIVSLLAIAATRRRIGQETKMMNLSLELAATELTKKHATTDFLTGHLNRFGIAQAIAEIDGRDYTLVIFDLDKFKEINDIHGHDIGDIFLQVASARIRADLSQDDIFGRWGGDEFLAVIKAPEPAAVGIVSRCIRRATDGPAVIAGKKLPVKVSAGLAPWDSSRDFESIFSDADKALYEAKSRGGCQTVSVTSLPNHGVGSKHAH